MISNDEAELQTLNPFWFFTQFRSTNTESVALHKLYPATNRDIDLLQSRFRHPVAKLPAPLVFYLLKSEEAGFA